MVESVRWIHPIQMTLLSKPQKEEIWTDTYSLCKIVLYLSKEMSLAQRLIPVAKENSLKAMGTLAKCPVGQTKEAEAKNRNVSTWIFETSFIMFTTCRSEKLITVHWLQNAKQSLEIKHSSFRATFLKNAHEVICSVCFKWDTSSDHFKWCCFVGTANLKFHPTSGPRSAVPLIDRHLPQAGVRKS